ncbi:MAG TPA: hypothetical protein VFQ14_02425 [Thermoleophilaceae bacterium]|nr:hypothetical protein [Thermoleophilaceae bacterium]
MTTRATLLAALCALVVAPGCGGDDGPPSSQQKPAGDTSVAITAPGETAPAPGPATTLAPEDKRGAALACIRDEKGIEAEEIGDKGIAIGADTPSGGTGGKEVSRIDFFQSSLEAEGAQFEGKGEGAEQIGAALFYVRELPEETLVEIEDCLNDQ